MNNPAGWSVRFATPEDSRALFLLEKECNPSGFWTEDQFQEEIKKKSTTFLLMTDDETDENIAAYCVFTQTPVDEKNSYFELLLLGVTKTFRKKGFAQLLLQKMIQDGIRRKIIKIMLDVRKSNNVAIALYHKFFFNIVSIRPRFYSNGEDAYEMVLDLQNTENNSLI